MLLESTNLGDIVGDLNQVKGENVIPSVNSFNEKSNKCQTSHGYGIF